MRLVRRAGVAALVLTTVVITGGPAFAGAPGNDTFAGATPVTAVPFSDTVDTTEATTDADDDEMNPEFCGAPATDASVWYSFTAASDGFIGVDVSESSYSAGVLVSTGSPGSFAFVTCGPGAVAFPVVTGETYAILAIDDQLDGGGNGGTLHINIAEVPPPPELDITVDKFGTFNSRTGTATISGTATCTGEAEFAEIFADVRQNVGRFTIRGFGFSELECDGVTRPFSLEIFPENGKFAGGKALTVAIAFGCGEFLCGEDFEERTVQLRGKK